MINPKQLTDANIGLHCSHFRLQSLHRNEKLTLQKKIVCKIIVPTTIVIYIFIYFFYYLLITVTGNLKFVTYISDYIQFCLIILACIFK